MQNVLADLAVESEAATLLMTRLAGATDRGETAFKRLGLAVGKYWACKRSRRIVERMALILQASLLVRHGHPAVADTFCASRLGVDWGHAYGTLPAGLDFGTIVERATPKIG